MAFPRRKFLELACSGAAVAALSNKTWAQAYPTRPIRIVVGFAAGGNGDILARLIGQWLSDRLGQPVVIENRPGAAGNIAAEVALRSPPDGYTLFSSGSASTINATLYEKLSFNFIQESVAVAGILRVANVLECHPSFPAKTLAEFMEYAKANPNAITWASSGNGTPNHLSGELFKAMTGIVMQHVPYRGSAPMLVDLIAGHVPVAFDPVPSSIEYIRTGKLRALGVTTAERMKMLPDVPPIGEFVPGYDTSSFFGISAPRGTPADIVDLLNREINAGLADPNIVARLRDLGGEPLVLSPSQFTKLIAEETEKWGKAVKFSGARAD
jgi:tripartite-type tricarboxylate transporter receptor subunit TctC